MEPTQPDNDIIHSKQEFLATTDVPEEAHSRLAVTVAYYSRMGGIEPATYWKQSPMLPRDECLLVYISLLATQAAILTNSSEDRSRLDFDWSYGYFLKPIAQAMKSVDALVQHACYIDAYSILRSVHSRMLLILTFATEPSLSEIWVKEPKNDMFFERNLRKRLENKSISTLEHLYRLGNEIVHNHSQGFGTIGFFEVGLFPKIEGLADQFYIIMTLLLAPIMAAGVSVLSYSDRNPEHRPLILELQSLRDFLVGNVVFPGRIQHLWASIAEDRHWKSTPDGTRILGQVFDYPALDSAIRNVFTASMDDSTESV